MPKIDGGVLLGLVDLAWTRMWLYQVGNGPRSSGQTLTWETRYPFLGRANPTIWMDTSIASNAIYRIKWKCSKLISRSSFLGTMWSISSTMENQQLTCYSGRHCQFLEVMKWRNRNWRCMSQQRDCWFERCARNKARVATRNMAINRQKKLDKWNSLSRARNQSHPWMQNRTPGRFIFQAKDLQIGYDRPWLALEPNIWTQSKGSHHRSFQRDRETTFLKSLLGPPIAGRRKRGGYLELGYFEQEVEGGTARHRLKQSECLSSSQSSRFVPPCSLWFDHQRSRVKFRCHLVESKPRCVSALDESWKQCSVLDEPTTNHLDVDAKDELKRNFKEYKGSILMVCHEPDFKKVDGPNLGLWWIDRKDKRTAWFSFSDSS